jgi:hypothetical protein
MLWKGPAKVAVGGMNFGRREVVVKFATNLTNGR